MLEYGNPIQSMHWLLYDTATATYELVNLLARHHA